MRGRWWLSVGALVASLAACAHSQTREGVLAAATHDLECEDTRLAVTEYATYEATVEGCGREGHFTFLDGDWRLFSRCEYRVTPSIPSCCSPNRGGESTCVSECTGYDECSHRPE